MEQRLDRELVERPERIERLLKIVAGGVGRQWVLLQVLVRDLYALRDEVGRQPEDPPQPSS